VVLQGLADLFSDGGACAGMNMTLTRISVVAGTIDTSEVVDISAKPDHMATWAEDILQVVSRSSVELEVELPGGIRLMLGYGPPFPERSVQPLPPDHSFFLLGFDKAGIENDETATFYVRHEKGVAVYAFVSKSTSSTAVLHGLVGGTRDSVALKSTGFLRPDIRSVVNSIVQTAPALVVVGMATRETDIVAESLCRAISMYRVRSSSPIGPPPI